MFTRFSFSSLSRVFRFRSRRGVRTNADSARPTRQFAPEPFPSKSRRPDPPQLEPINTTLTPSTTRPRQSLFRSLLSPISQSPITTTPGVTTVPDSLSPVLIIGRDPAQSTLLSSTVIAPWSDIGPQTHVEEPAPTHPNARRISFQLPTTHTEQPPESPLSKCSTLISDVEAQAEIGPVVSPEQPLALEAPDFSSVHTASAELGVGLDNLPRSGSGRVRPVSLSIPQRVRADVSRFSLPVMPMATASTDARSGRRKSKRMSLTSLLSGSGSTKKDKRPSWLSRELSKPETQEVLRALAYVM